MKVMITGANGQLGTDLCKTLKQYQVIPLTISDGDITDFNFVARQGLKHKPDVIINTAAYVLVDDCEENRDIAFKVNALGARNMAVVAEANNAKMVQISTDYVFGGENRSVNIPLTEFDKPIPRNVYGESKLAGEEYIRHMCKKHFIIRSSALFGVAGAMGKGGNFIETMLQLAGTQDELRVINDQIFSPTYTSDLAQKIAQLIRTEYYGIFHITNTGICSWYEFAVEILKKAGLNTPVIPILTEQYPQKANRPKYSVLDNYHLRLVGMDPMPAWQEAVSKYMKEKKYLGKSH